MFDAIRDLKEMPWPLNRYIKDISVGDKAIIWISGKKAGIYAFGEIIEPVKIFDELSDIDYWIDEKTLNKLRRQPGPRIRLTTKLLDKPLLRQKLNQDPILKNLDIIRIKVGSVFQVTLEQWNRIYELINLHREIKENSETEINYTQLKHFLAHGQWKEADEETANLMLKVSNRIDKIFLTLENIKNFPSNILNEINQLWLDYSNNHFGFSIQKEIYINLGGDQEYNQYLWNIFGKKIGWKDENTDNWLYYSKLNFSITAPRGHLPALPIWSKNRFHRGQRGVAFLSHPDLVLPKVENQQYETLQTFTFETVTVNRQGEIIKTETQEAQYFTEILPDNILLEMIAIPGGTFMMGTPKNELQGQDDEKPQHQVTIQSFFMGKYLVTQAQWKAIAQSSNLKVNIDLKPDPSSFKGDDLPVETVNWYEAKEFCDRLSKLTGRKYRLPSEAEWEYACRAGTTTPFTYGETLTDKLANYGATINYADEPIGSYISETTPVGSFYPNNFGLYDMHGNVDEWCEDDWHNNYDDAPTDGSAWLTGITNDTKVLRGGSFNYLPWFCRSGVRINPNIDAPFKVYGLRVVCGSETHYPLKAEKEADEISEYSQNENSVKQVMFFAFHLLIQIGLHKIASLLMQEYLDEK